MASRSFNERPLNLLLHYQELEVSLHRLLLNPCLDLLRTNQWRGSFFCHCLQKRNYTTALICLERKQHFGWRGVCSTTHHPRLWLELGLISSIHDPVLEVKSHEWCFTRDRWLTMIAIIARTSAYCRRVLIGIPWYTCTQKHHPKFYNCSRYKKHVHIKNCRF